MKHLTTGLFLLLTALSFAGIGCGDDEAELCEDLPARPYCERAYVCCHESDGTCRLGAVQNGEEYSWPCDSSAAPEEVCQKAIQAEIALCGY